MRKALSAPATIIVSTGVNGGLDDRTITHQAWLSDQWGVPYTLEWGDGYSAILMDLAEVELNLPGLLTGTTMPNKFKVTVRATEEDDGVGLDGMPRFPIPVTVIGSILSGENVDTHVEALVEDDGYVATLLLVTDIGLWVRYSSQWLRLWDVDPIGSLTSVEVADEAVDLYDAVDRAGNQIPVESLPGPDKTTGLPQAPGEAALNVSAGATMTFTPETVTASMAMINVKIDTVRDLPAAIEAAAGDPSIRWYVERRGRALDPEIKFPWDG